MSVVSLKKILKKLTNKEYRDAYATEHVQTSLPFQIRALREQRGWTQARLAVEAGTTQTAVSRIEDPEYGRLSLNTLYKLASAFDVALLVKFVPFSRLLEEFKDVSVEALAVESFNDELPKLEEKATNVVSTTAEVDPPIWSFISTRGRALQLEVIPSVVFGNTIRLHTEPILPNATWLTPEQNRAAFTETETKPFFRKTPGTPIPALPDVQELSTYTM
jgi:transcriptional regulator with XRE-family HTH domain